jgi:pyridoxine/pyridoxamine 5'-phosphate oxidase
VAAVERTVAYARAVAVAAAATAGSVAVYMVVVRVIDGSGVHEVHLSLHPGATQQQ